MASANWDTDRKRRMPPAWDPPKLLLVVVSGLHVVVVGERSNFENFPTHTQDHGDA